MAKSALEDAATIIVRGLVLAGITWLLITTADVQTRVKLLEWRLMVLEATLDR